MLARSQDQDYLATLDESHGLFKKYQMAVHKDPESRCTKSRYENFLCKSTLQVMKLLRTL